MHILSLFLHLQELKNMYTRINNLTAAEREWTSTWRSGEKQRMVPLHLLTGSVLPLLPTIQKVAEKFRGPGGRSVRLKVRHFERRCLLAVWVCLGSFRLG